MIANAAITLPYYSYIENPQGYPDWYDYTPTYDATGSMTFTLTDLQTARLQVVGKTCHVIIVAIGTTGGTASFGIKASLPITNTNVASPSCAIVCGVKDGTTYVNVGTGAIDSTYMNFRKYDASVWGVSTGRVIVGDAWFEI